MDSATSQKLAGTAPASGSAESGTAIAGDSSSAPPLVVGADGASSEFREVTFGRAGRFHVPLDQTGPIRYFLDELLPAHGTTERMLRGFARRLPARLAAPLLLRYRWSVALDSLGAAADEPPGKDCFGLPSGDATDSLGRPVGVASVSGVLRRLARELPVRGSMVETGKLRWILLEDYARSERRNALVFIFNQDRPRPSAVLKMRVGGSATDDLLREEDALKALQRKLPRALRATVPRVLAHETTAAGDESLLITFVPGRSAYVELRNASRPKALPATHFRAAARWLVQFHQGTKSSRAFRPDGEHRAVERAQDAARGSDELAWLEELGEILAERPLPMASAHGDFWARNLLVSSRPDALASVVDWEYFEEEAPPFVDLFHFPMTYGWIYPWTKSDRAPEKIFRLTFLEETELSREVRRYLRAYCEGTGLDRRALKPLLHLYLLTRFSRLAPRQLGQYGKAVEPDALALSLHRVLAASDRPFVAL